MPRRNVHTPVRPSRRVPIRVLLVRERVERRNVRRTGVRGRGWGEVQRRTREVHESELLPVRRGVVRADVRYVGGRGVRGGDV